MMTCFCHRHCIIIIMISIIIIIITVLNHSPAPDLVNGQDFPIHRLCPGIGVTSAPSPFKSIHDFGQPISQSIQLIPHPKNCSQQPLGQEASAVSSCSLRDKAGRHSKKKYKPPETELVPTGRRLALTGAWGMASGTRLPLHRALKDEQRSDRFRFGRCSN